LLKLGFLLERANGCTPDYEGHSIGTKVFPVRDKSLRKAIIKREIVTANREYGVGYPQRASEEIRTNSALPQAVEKAPRREGTTPISFII
jgi:hypothetical protein